MGEALGPAAAVRQMQALLAYPGCGDLGAIQCPVAVISSAEDRRVTPEAHEELARLIPRAVLSLVERAGDFAPLEAPGAVNDALRAWLVDPGR